MDRIHLGQAPLPKSARIPWLVRRFITPLFLGLIRARVGGVTVSIAAFQAVDPGSTPGQRMFFLFFFWLMYLIIHVYLLIFCLHRCKTKKLQNTLNLHPASGELSITQWTFLTANLSQLHFICFALFEGIQPWESSYEDMAKAMGIDPSVSYNDYSSMKLVWLITSCLISDQCIRPISTN